MISAEQLEQLRTMAMSGSDDDLEPEDRRDRANILPNLHLTFGQQVTVVDGQVVTVLGPGRGRSWFTAAYEDDYGVGYGSYSEEQVLT